MKRILINATHNEEIRVALCKDNHLYDFDLENRTREQKKANIYKGRITRVEPSLEAAFVEYGSLRQGFLPLREIAPEYLHGNLREESIKQLLKEGDEIIVQVEKEERGNKGAALSTYISLAGRYLVLMPNNAKGGGISRQISGKVREEMKQIIASLDIPKHMSIIVRTAGLGKGFEDLQNDLNHLLDIWSSIQTQNKTRPSPCLVHQEAGVVTRAVRDYLRDDIGEIWIDSENAYNEAANFIAAVMPTQLDKLRKYTDYEPMFARFGIERQIETAYQREVRLPSGGSIVIDQTEALVSIDINSSKSTKGSDVAETAYHTNLEAADEIARQLRLRDMGGLIVIDFIDMADARHQKEVEKRLIEATRHDRARVQFAEISKFGLMQMSRQRLRPSLEEATGYICPRCHGNGMIRDLRSLSLSIMRQIEQIALKERSGEIQAEVPTEIAAFLLNEKRESLVYLEQDSGARVTILPHAHLESPNFSLHFNPDGFAPSSYERIVNAEEEEMGDRGYDVNWQTQQAESTNAKNNRWQDQSSAKPNEKKSATTKTEETQAKPAGHTPQAVAWLSNLFAPKPQAKLADSLNSADAALAIESLVNSGNVSLGAAGQIAIPTKTNTAPQNERGQYTERDDNERKPRHKKPKKETLKDESNPIKERQDNHKKKEEKREYPKREVGSRRESRGEVVREPSLTLDVPNAVEKSTKKESQERPQKAVNSTDIVLHITPIIKEKLATEVVHVCLDGDKSTKKAPSKTKTDYTTSNKATHAQGNAQQDADHTPSAKEEIQPNEKDVTVAPSIPDVSEKQAIDDTAPSHDAHTSTPSSQADKPKLAVPAVATWSKADDATKAKLAALAKQTGRAINDPRVVRSLSSAVADITGTAGDFIERTLGTSADGDFIHRFIAAVVKARSGEAVDFSNYGYASLGETYLTEYAQQITAKSKTSVLQGKTAVTPSPIGRRASNDPRGQHPDFYKSDTSSTADQATPADKPIADDADTYNALTGGEAALAVSEQSEALLHQVDVIDDSHKQEEPKADATQPDESQDANAITAIEEIKQADKTDGDEQTDTPAKSGDDTQVAVIDDKTPKVKPTPKAKVSVSRNAKKGKVKTNSYKDMIENVAGQLLPQVGILTLAQPKSKVRAKKTSKAAQKSEVRKAGAKINKPETPSDTDTNG
ncbi:Rne/Rng family ribonuclease [Moraxella nasovis]|uniref:Rne/Rng family ribonuclease n=1 Tax=Moraxella nasovis TaxID=2904121 RepID=UPI001F61E393|nr:Rne/Rng family ribonuclease [Moraxella nasovis]UNU72776.1 Rne/Rng family ribonuclease [Moraxella nasovis]